MSEPAQARVSHRRFRRLGLISAAAALVAGAAWLFYDNIVRKPFGYVQMAYADEVREFNAPPAALRAQFGIGRDLPPPKHQPARRLKQLDLDSQIREATVIVRSIQSVSTDQGRIRSATELFRRGPEFRDICSEHAKIFAAIMESLGRQARVVWMCGHTVAEVYDPTQGWRLVDTYGNVMFTQAGRPLSLLDTIGNDRAEPISIVMDKSKPDYIASGYVERASSVYRINDCFVVLDPDDVNGFHRRVRDPASLMRALFLGDDAVARGLQYVGSADEFGNFGVGLWRRFLH